ncbi:MAG: RNA polymerase sigma factor, partial [Actinomycetota bacterium]
MPVPASTRIAEDAVIQAARAGDARAWNEIDLRFRPALTRYAASKGVADPEDLAQEVMYAAVRQIHQVEGGWESLQAWLFTVAYRRCADYHRRRYRRVETLTDTFPEWLDPSRGADEFFLSKAERREATDALS